MKRSLTVAAHRMRTGGTQELGHGSIRYFFCSVEEEKQYELSSLWS